MHNNFQNALFLSNTGIFASRLILFQKNNPLLQRFSFWLQGNAEPDPVIYFQTLKIFGWVFQQNQSSFAIKHF